MATVQAKTISNNFVTTLLRNKAEDFTEEELDSKIKNRIDILYRDLKSSSVKANISTTEKLFILIKQNRIQRSTITKQTSCILPLLEYYYNKIEIITKTV